MAIDYKRQAINNYLIEMYCDQGEKYPSKYKDLIERASLMPEDKHDDND
jgi:hypothetical protein